MTKDDLDALYETPISGLPLGDGTTGIALPRVTLTQ